MNRPTDPAKLAALRERQKRNSANYRARKKAEAARRVAPADSGIVTRATNYAEGLRQKRAALLSTLPDVRNPRAKLRPGEVTEREPAARTTRKGQATQAARIRDQANAQRLRVQGRARQNQLRSELELDPTGRLHDTLTAEQRREFQQLSEKIASGSQQSTGILFEHAGGSGLYNGALERILASPESRDVEEGLAMLARLADMAADAKRLYSTSAIGRIDF